MPSLPPGAFRAVPAALFGVGTVAGAVGSGLGAMGARDLVAAHERQAAAKQQYESRAAVSEDLREVANQRLIDFSALQREAFTGVVQRMVVWLRSHAKQVRESDRLLVDGLEVSLSLMPPLSAAKRPSPAG
ncbi:hypothetical protein GCM10025862_36710 [Arsenicicoccus piscis]|uniref:Uncharacterized protein n=1 Tax=Arsenicicoccus piscis TaxID=673954 RepID=A0ABQ6HTN0_9MICO|nr:hypothetical protein GCM10025862_36710 [Arsenicicoccus piscis]